MKISTLELLTFFVEIFSELDIISGTIFLTINLTTKNTLDGILWGLVFLMIILLGITAKIVCRDLERYTRNLRMIYPCEK